MHYTLTLILFSVSILAQAYRSWRISPLLVVIARGVVLMASRSRSRSRLRALAAPLPRASPEALAASGAFYWDEVETNLRI